jgi:hypothetical protein
MATPQNKVAPKYVIDLHGVIGMLKSKNKKIQSDIIGHIKSGEMLILRTVSDEIKFDNDLYKKFQDIKPKKYLQIPVAIGAVAAVLIEDFEGNILAPVPAIEIFEAVAAASSEGLILVSSGKGFNSCNGIAKKCKLKKLTVVKIENYA